MSLKDLPEKPNVVFIITDQQSQIQYYTDEWAENNLPGMKKLKDNGITFKNAHCNSATCSPSRTTLFTGTYPAHHKVNQVLAFDNPSDDKQPMQQVLSNNYQNMFKMMESAGYHVAYKGKWHISKPANFVVKEANDQYRAMDQLYWTPEDSPHISDLYGANEWNYPDAGDDGSLFNFGGGDINNDGRFVDGNGQSAWYGDNPPIDNRVEASALSFINNYKKDHNDKPFFLVVSLVNPHDVLSYPGGPGTGGYTDAGYKDEDFERIDVTIPSTWDESLDSKPTVQTQWRGICRLANGNINTQSKATKYVQFYAYLTSLVDQEINKVLVALDDNGFNKDTLIVRLSDHGDMAMAHGMQRQKMYNVYQESLNVPLIFSNPIFKKMDQQTTDAYAGLIDLMPTLAEIAGVEPGSWNFQGESLVPILNNPNKEVNDYIHFTYDDNYFMGNNPKDMGPCHIRCVIQKQKNKVWKYAVYFDPDFGQPAQYEMYELVSDQYETKNLADPQYSTPDSVIERQRLHELLTKVMLEKGTLPDSIIWPKISGKE